MEHLFRAYVELLQAMLGDLIQLTKWAHRKM